MSDMKRIKQLNETLRRVIEGCPTLVFIGDKVLRTKTRNTILEEGIEIGVRLKEVLKKYRDVTGFGRGLAAPQIGESTSVFVTCLNDEFKTYINPRITKESEGSNFYREGCISCGYIWADVKRPASITLEHINERGETQIEEADGFLARLLQHEHDHLLGIVNVDKAEPNSIEFMVSDPLQEELREK